MPLIISGGGSTGLGGIPLDDSGKADGKILKYNATAEKFEFANVPRDEELETVVWEDVVTSETALQSMVTSESIMDDAISSSNAKEIIEDSELAMTAVNGATIAIAKYITNLVGLDHTQYSNLSAMVASSAAMAAIASSQNALDAAVESQPAMNSIVDSQIAMDAMMGSSSAITTIEGSTIAMDELNAATVGMAKYITKKAGLTYSDYDDMSDVVSSETAMAAIAGSSSAMNVVKESSDAMAAIAGSSTAMAEIIDSSTAMTIVTNSQTAMDVIGDSYTAMNAIGTSATALAYFLDHDEAEILWNTDSPHILKQSSAKTRLPINGDEAVSTEVDGDRIYTYSMPSNYALLVQKSGQHSFDTTGGDVKFNGVQYAHEDHVVSKDYNASSVSSGITSTNIHPVEVIKNGGTIQNLGGINQTLYAVYGIWILPNSEA